jgi:hypothetical protein
MDYQTLTGPVRSGEIPWTVKGYRAARLVVLRARSGELRLPRAVAGLPPDVLEETSTDELALGLWLRREHRDESPEVPASHHLRFHAIERFLDRHADLLGEEGLLRPVPGPGDEDDERAAADVGDGGAGTGERVEPDPLLIEELVTRPYDTPLAEDALPGFDAGEVLKAVARSVRQTD